MKPHGVFGPDSLVSAKRKTETSKALSTRMQRLKKKSKEIGILKLPKKELLENSFFRYYIWTGRLGDFLGNDDADRHI